MSVQTSGTVHLGFEVGSGAPVRIPLRHMVVTGQTQEAGKTTTLEALIARSRARAVTFVTKRGEGAFAGGRRLAPFFRERADWVFVSSLIDATLGEKNKLLRAWLMKVCRDTKTLAEVQRNVIREKGKARGFAESIYTEIEGYLELVVPQLAQLPPSRGVTIGAGLNVMDLSGYSTELQALVIRSVLEHVYENEQGVITVIPEAWEFLPEGRGSPVKCDAETLIRKGAGLGNYVWLDSQDLAGVWKTAVRAAPVVLIGVQREANEIKRTLANIPAGIAKPSAAAIATLGLGEFFACWGTHTLKVYVQPTWLSEDDAQAFARGVRQGVPNRPAAVRIAVEEQVTPAEAAQLREENEQLREGNERLGRQVAELTRRLAAIDALGEFKQQVSRPAAAIPSDDAAFLPPSLKDFEELYRRVKERLARDAPALLKVVTIRPELEVEIVRETITVDGTSLRGRIARLLAEGFLDKGVTANGVQNELARRGKDPGPGNAYAEMKNLAELGFVTVEEGKDEKSRKRTLYVAVPGMKVNVIERRA